MMACVTPSKLQLHSTYPNPPHLSNFHSSPKIKRKSHLGGFQSKKWRNLLWAGGENQYIRKESWCVKNDRRKKCCEAVKCTAEGVERCLLLGNRGEESGGFMVAERFKVVALMAGIMSLCNADRVVMSVAIVPLAAKYGWRSSDLGIIQSSFLWGYIFSSVIGGALVDKYGGKRVIAWGAALWSLATLLTPWAANHSTGSLLAVRTFFGLAEGVALPSMNTLLSRWFPSHERATAVGIAMGGFHLGNVVGLILTPLLMSSIGISGPFILFSSLGFLWLTTWSYRVTDDPLESNSVSKSELRLIQAGKSDSQVIKGKLPPLRLLLSKLPSWAIIFANITNNWGYFVLLSWMPVYFKTVFDINLKQAAWFSALPWGTMAISGCIAGATSDYLIKSGYSITSARKIMQVYFVLGSHYTC
ncbi:probable anion transporter 3, chloroplastic [Olea europaea subsp. europaea]|uniref:Probable anion transporter 3, chloroplastic n=1 Tax=Olea europaea subsp. europaea TaxID=158383 RepID=A0A8S0PJE8_OLEEU|nr:probable anion transporter 3, chloroplastic [Olea europaea subsp. europaea]